MGGNNTNSLLTGAATGQFFPSGGKGSQPPPAPDYGAAARAQGTANLGTALAQSQLSNPNVVTPYGSQTINYGPRTFDQTGYDAFNKQQRDLGATNDAPVDSFWNAGSPTVTQQLSPSGQKLFDLQNQTQAGLGGLANQGISQVQGALGQSFDPSLPNQVSSLGQGNFQGGPAPTTSGNGGIGNAGDISRGFADVGGNQRGIDFGGAPGSPQASFTGANDPVTQSIIQRNQPFADRQRAQLDTQLHNQGLVPGDEAYSNAMSDFGRQQNDFNLGAIQSGAQQQNQMFGQQLAARQQGVGEIEQQGQFQNSAQAQAFQQAAMRGDFGNQAQQQAFSQNLAGANYGLGAQQQAYGQQAQTAQMGNQAQQANLAQQQAAATFQNQSRQQAMQEAAYRRSLPLNEVSALMSGSQVTAPQFQGFNGTTVGQTPIFGGAQAQGQYAADVYNQQMAQQNAMTSGIFGLGGTIGAAALSKAPIIMAAGSDRRMKQDIERIGTHPRGFGIYRFQYKPEFAEWGQGVHIGVMADEVEPIIPEAVTTLPNGYKAVYYGRL